MNETAGQFGKFGVLGVHDVELLAVAFGGQESFQAAGNQGITGDASFFFARAKHWSSSVLSSCTAIVCWP